MSIDLTLDEQEKIDQIKLLWNAYGHWLLTLLLIIVVGVVGMQWWQHKKVQQAGQAASLYATLQTMQQARQTRAVTTLAETLMKQTPDSPYATRAALIAAAANAGAQQTATTAQNELQWVVDHSHESGIHSIAQLHLAGMLFDQNKPADALKLLDAPHDESDADLYSDLKGDVLVQLGQRAAARNAYQIALEKLPADNPYRQVVEIKLNAIAGVAAK